MIGNIGTTPQVLAQNSQDQWISDPRQVRKLLQKRLCDVPIDPDIFSFKDCHDDAAEKLLQLQNGCKIRFSDKFAIEQSDTSAVRAPVILPKQFEGCRDLQIDLCVDRYLHWLQLILPLLQKDQTLHIFGSNKATMPVALLLLVTTSPNQTIADARMKAIFPTAKYYHSELLPIKRIQRRVSRGAQFPDFLVRPPISAAAGEIADGKHDHFALPVYTMQRAVDHVSIRENMVDPYDTNSSTPFPGTSRADPADEAQFKSQNPQAPTLEQVDADPVGPVQFDQNAAAKTDAFEELKTKAGLTDLELNNLLIAACNTDLFWLCDKIFSEFEGATIPSEVELIKILGGDCEFFPGDAGDLKWLEFVRGWVDDFAFAGGFVTNVLQNNKYLRGVMDLLISLGKRKSFLFASDTVSNSHIHKNGTRMLTHDKCRAVRSWSPPTHITELRGLLGLAQFCRAAFGRSFAYLCSLLYPYTSKLVKMSHLYKNPAAREALKRVRRAMTNIPIHAIQPERIKSGEIVLAIFTDASKHGLGYTVVGILREAWENAEKPQLQIGKNFYVYEIKSLPIRPNTKCSQVFLYEAACLQLYKNHSFEQYRGLPQVILCDHSNLMEVDRELLRRGCRERFQESILDAMLLFEQPEVSKVWASGWSNILGDLPSREENTIKASSYLQVTSISTSTKLLDLLLPTVENYQFEKEEEEAIEAELLEAERKTLAEESNSRKKAKRAFPKPQGLVDGLSAEGIRKLRSLTPGSNKAEQQQQKDSENPSAERFDFDPAQQAKAQQSDSDPVSEGSTEFYSESESESDEITMKSDDEMLQSSEHSEGVNLQGCGSFGLISGEEGESEPSAEDDSDDDLEIQEDLELRRLLLKNRLRKRIHECKVDKLKDATMDAIEKILNNKNAPMDFPRKKFKLSAMQIDKLHKQSGCLSVKAITDLIARSEFYAAPRLIAAVCRSCPQCAHKAHDGSVNYPFSAHSLAPNETQIDATYVTPPKNLHVPDDVVHHGESRKIKLYVLVDGSGFVTANLARKSTPINIQMNRLIAQHETRFGQMRYHFGSDKDVVAGIGPGLRPLPRFKPILLSKVGLAQSMIKRLLKGQAAKSASGCHLQSSEGEEEMSEDSEDRVFNEVLDELHNTPMGEESSDSGSFESGTSTSSRVEGARTSLRDIEMALRECVDSVNDLVSQSLDLTDLNPPRNIEARALALFEQGAIRLSAYRLATSANIRKMLNAQLRSRFGAGPPQHMIFPLHVLCREPEERSSFFVGLCAGRNSAGDYLVERTTGGAPLVIHRSDMYFERILVESDMPALEAIMKPFLATHNIRGFAGEFSVHKVSDGRIKSSGSLMRLVSQSLYDEHEHIQASISKLGVDMVGAFGSGVIDSKPVIARFFRHSEGHMILSNPNANFERTASVHRFDLESHEYGSKQKVPVIHIRMSAKDHVILIQREAHPVREPGGIHVEYPGSGVFNNVRESAMPLEVHHDQSKEIKLHNFLRRAAHALTNFQFEFSFGDKRRSSIPKQVKLCKDGSSHQLIIFWKDGSVGRLIPSAVNEYFKMTASKHMNADQMLRKAIRNNLGISKSEEIASANGQCFARMLDEISASLGLDRLEKQNEIHVTKTVFKQARSLAGTQKYQRCVNPAPTADDFSQDAKWVCGHQHKLKLNPDLDNFCWDHIMAAVIRPGSESYDKKSGPIATFSPELITPVLLDSGCLGTRGTVHSLCTPSFAAKLEELGFPVEQLNQTIATAGFSGEQASLDVNPKVITLYLIVRDQNSGQYFRTPSIRARVIRGWSAEGGLALGNRDLGRFQTMFSDDVHVSMAALDRTGQRNVAIARIVDTNVDFKACREQLNQLTEQEDAAAKFASLKQKLVLGRASPSCSTEYDSEIESGYDSDDSAISSTSSDSSFSESASESSLPSVESSNSSMESSRFSASLSSETTESRSTSEANSHSQTPIEIPKEHESSESQFFQPGDIVSFSVRVPYKPGTRIKLMLVKRDAAKWMITFTGEFFGSFLLTNVPNPPVIHLRAHFSGRGNCLAEDQIGLMIKEMSKESLENSLSQRLLINLRSQERCYKMMENGQLWKTNHPDAIYVEGEYPTERLAESDKSEDFSNFSQLGMSSRSRKAMSKWKKKFAAIRQQAKQALHEDVVVYPYENAEARYNSVDELTQLTIPSELPSELASFSHAEEYRELRDSVATFCPLAEYKKKLLGGEVLTDTVLGELEKEEKDFYRRFQLAEQKQGTIVPVRESYEHLSSHVDLGHFTQGREKHQEDISDLLQLCVFIFSARNNKAWCDDGDPVPPARIPEIDRIYFDFSRPLRHIARRKDGRKTIQSWKISCLLLRLIVQGYLVELQDKNFGKRIAYGVKQRLDASVTADVNHIPISIASQLIWAFRKGRGMGRLVFDLRATNSLIISAYTTSNLFSHISHLILNPVRVDLSQQMMLRKNKDIKERLMNVVNLLVDLELNITSYTETDVKDGYPRMRLARSIIPFCGVEHENLFVLIRCPLGLKCAPAHFGSHITSYLNHIRICWEELFR